MAAHVARAMTVATVMVFVVAAVASLDAQSPTEEAVTALARVLLDPKTPLPWRAPMLPTLPTLPTLPSLPSIPDDVTAQCRSDLQHFWQNYASTIWGLKMFDASTKIPEGLIFGNLVHLGNFDECLSVRQGKDGSRFDGQHCLVSLTASSPVKARARDRVDVFSQWEAMLLGEGIGQMLASSRGDLLTSMGVSSVPVQVSWCVPSSCEPTDLEKIAGAALNATAEQNNLIIAAKVQPSQCHKPEVIHLRGIDIFAICVLGLFVLCAVLSTIYDVITQERAQRTQILLAFSVYSNFPKLTAVITGPDQLTCLNGIRTISIGWVVLGHVYLVNASMPSINSLDYLPDFIKSLSRLTIMNATVSVDTFFMLSGLLLSFLFLKEVEKTNHFNIVKFYVHRYVRLTPALAIMVFLQATIFNYMGTGPLWHSRHNAEKEACESNWWTNLLYVNNYVNPREMCLGQTWYLAVDMQLHWLSPIVLLPLWKLPKRFARYWIYFLLLLGWAIPFTIVYLMELYPGLYVGPAQKRTDTMKYYYWPTHTRYVPWLLGVLLGYILRESRKKKPELHPWVITCGWIISTVFMTGALNAAYPFQQPGYVYSRVEAAFWLSLFRAVWALGLGWIIFACDIGIGGLVDTILSWNFFQPLARLSYGVYLTHVTILNLFAGSQQSPIHLADVNSIPQFLGVLIMSVAWAIPLALLFESPIILIEKFIFGGGGGRRPAPVAEKERNENGLENGLENGAPASNDGPKA